MAKTLIKRFLSLTLALCMLFGLTGCGDSKPNGNKVTVPTDSDTYEKDGIIYVGEDTKVSYETTVKNFGDFSSESDDEAAKLRKEIIDAKDTIKVEGTTWYISNDGDDNNEGNSPKKAWKTLNALTINEYKIKAGDAILFNRGDIFRGNFNTISGVSYGAYGSGDKPAIYGCKTNYANETWRRTSEENVYALIYTASSDVGMIIFNHGEAYGNKKVKNVFECDEDYEFYHDQSEGVVYLYCSKGKPSDVFYDIELLYNKSIVSIKSGAENVYIENLCLKYTGAFGIAVGKPVSGITIKNCEIGWIGGSIHKAASQTRYGNGIQFYGQTTDATVDHCWVYQCYDAGLTHQQGNENENSVTAENITYTKNLIEFCTYSLEYFWSVRKNGEDFDDPGTYMKNITVENNIMRFAGYGLGQNRPDPSNTGHIVTWSGRVNRSENFVVKNNIFDTSTVNLFNISTWLNVTPNFSDNTFIQAKGNKFGSITTEKKTKGGALELNEAALKSFDKSGTLIIN